MGEQDALTIGEIGRTLERLDKGQEAILERIDLMRGEFVHRPEWERQNQVTEKELSAATSAISTLKRELVGVVAFVITAALGIVGAYIQSGRL